LNKKYVNPSFLSPRKPKQNIYIDKEKRSGMGGKEKKRVRRRWMIFNLMIINNWRKGG